MHGHGHHRQGDAELAFSQLGDRKKLEHDALTQIRKQSLYPYNRLHSIAEDVGFVQTVYEKYPEFPLVANLRCGAWYCDSRTANGVTAHFKSSDGHYNGWSFNLRRPNLHILPLIQDAFGISLVDSTRSGKRIPDSFSKTVPIWCTVINRAIKLRGMTQSDNWDTRFYTPPQSVSKQEHSQIEEKIDAWANSLAGSSYDLPYLSKSVRPIWITPAMTTFPTFDETTPFFPVICIPASKLLEEGAERRRKGYSYVQGAGDDHEHWSAGLTPDMFWEHKNELLNAPELDFPDVLARIVAEARSSSRSLGKMWVQPPTPVAHVGGLITISALQGLPESVSNPQTSCTMAGTPVPCIIVRMDSVNAVKVPNDSLNMSDSILEVVIPGDKKSGERAFKSCLPKCLNFIRDHIREQQQICIACDTGKDLSVGIALVALQAFFDDNGALDLDRYDHKGVKVNKDTIRTRLHWIITSRPEANPSRATLKRINEFFMSPAHNSR